MFGNTALYLALADNYNCSKSLLERTGTILRIRRHLCVENKTRENGLGFTPLDAAMKNSIREYSIRSQKVNISEISSDILELQTCEEAY